MAKRRSSAGGGAMKAAVATVLGGATGAVVAAAAKETKLKPSTVSVGLLAGGAAGAYWGSGSMRWFCAGLATSGASQLSANWAEQQLKRKAIGGAPFALAGTPIRNLGDGRNLGRGEILEAFEEAQAEVERELGR